MGFQELQLSPGAAMPIEALADVGDLSQAWDGGGGYSPRPLLLQPFQGSWFPLDVFWARGTHNSLKFTSRDEA